MPNVLSNSFRIALPLGLGLMSCWRWPAGLPPRPASRPRRRRAARPRQLPRLRPFPSRRSRPPFRLSPAESSSPAQPTDEPAAETVVDRPTLKAGVIWLDSPLDPVEGGYVATQSAMSETLFRLSGTTLSPEPWLATEATQVEPFIWRIGIREGVKFHNGT